MNNKRIKPRLLLHACCAPCLTSVYEQLKDNYNVTIYWFNPNIEPKEEYQKRLVELIRYCKIIRVKLVMNDDYSSDNFSWKKVTKDFFNEKEGGERCNKCIKYRLIQTGKYASDNNFDYFGTTLSVSPHKNSEKINILGEEISGKVESDFLKADFKKNNGFARSIEICKEFDIYRQKYCGCRFSQ